MIHALDSFPGGETILISTTSGMNSEGWEKAKARKTDLRAFERFDWVEMEGSKSNT
jgi:hypothetical protein